MTTLKPKLDSQTTDPIRQAQLISGMFPDRNAAKAITEILQQYTKLEKDAAQMIAARKAMNVGEYNAGSYDYQMQAFHTQWDALLTALGSTMVPKATQALAKINDVLSGMATWAGDKSNMKTIKLIGDGMAALGLALAGTGAAALIGAMGPTGWLVAGVIALSGAVAGINGNVFAGLGQKIHDSLKIEMSGFSAAGAFAGIGSKIYQTLKSEVMDEIANFGKDLHKLGIDPAGGAGPGKTGKPWREGSSESKDGSFGSLLKSFGIDPAGSTDSPGKTGRPIKNMSFNPGQQTMTAQPIQISMNVDGRSLGQAVSEQLMYLATFATSAPSANGRSFPSGGDHNFSST
jgi:hypothetical protein